VILSAYGSDVICLKRAGGHVASRRVLLYNRI